MIKSIQDTKIYKIMLLILSLFTFLLYLPTAVINIQSKFFRIAQIIWGALFLVIAFAFFSFDNLITFLIGIILVLAGIHQIWLGISGKSKKIEADYIAKKSNPLENVKICVNSYNRLCDKAFESFTQLTKESEIVVHKNLKLEIAILLYLAFDSAMANGENNETRNKFRDTFFESIHINEVENEIINSRVDEYLHSVRSENDLERQRLSFGNVFAKNTGNANNIFVVTWAILQHGNAFRFVTDVLMKDLNLQ